MDGVPVHTLAHASAQGSYLDVLSLDWEDDDDELIAQQLLFSASPSCFRDTTVQRGGSRPGKSKNKERDFEARYKRFMKQYFDENPVYNDDEFRERNRMSKPMFMRVLEGVLDVDSEYFEQRRDATGRIGIYPIMKISAALRVLAYGIPAACVDENLEISSTVVYNSIMHFVTAVDKRFGAEYLRSPTEEDTMRLLETNASRGFVGMWCSIDCMHWEWKNCPYGWAGQFKGKEKKPTIVLEACADQELWIWHASFGWPGSLNDLNILDRSPVFDKLMNGTTPCVEFEVNGHVYNMAYCLADGIYPEWPVFIKSLPQPHGNKQKKFAERQESVRKDVERAFGVLQARWRILAIPCKVHSRLDMNKVMRACVTLHNMICEENRYSNVDEHAYLFKDQKNRHLYKLRVSRPSGLRPRSISELGASIHALENEEQYFKLQHDVMEHIWRVFGEEE